MNPLGKNMLIIYIKYNRFYETEIENLSYKDIQSRYQISSKMISKYYKA